MILMETHRLTLSFIVFGAIIIALFFSNPSITGFVPTEIYSQKLDIDVFESQRFVLTSSFGGPVKIGTLALSGSILGPGLMNAYLSDGTSQWLIYSNKKRPGSSMASITGLAVSSLDIEPGKMLNKIESLPAGYTTKVGAFKNECMETCIMDENLFNKDELYIDIIISPDTILHISEIAFSAMG